MSATSSWLVAGTVMLTGKRVRGWGLLARRQKPPSQQQPWPLCGPGAHKTMRAQRALGTIVLTRVELLPGRLQT